MCASSHITDNIECFETFSEDHETIRVGGGHEISYLGRGTCLLSYLLPDGSVSPVCLKNVLYVPNFSYSLLSWRTIKDHFCFHSVDNEIVITLKNHSATVFWAEFKGNLPFVVKSNEIGLLSVVNIFDFWYQSL